MAGTLSFGTIVSVSPRSPQRVEHLVDPGGERRQLRYQPRWRGRLGDLALGQRRRVEEAGQLPVAVGACPGGRVMVYPERGVQEELVAGPGARDVEQPPLLGQPGRRGQ